MRFLFFFLLLTSLNTNAGREGHGGDVIVCFKGSSAQKQAQTARNLLKEKINPFDPTTLTKVGSVRLLDFWEYGIQGGNQVTRQEYINDIVQKLDKAYYFYASKINYIRNKKITFQNYSSLPILSDEGIVPNVPKGCLIVQIAIQKENGVVLIDRSLLNKLSKKDQAGLYMHEYLYRFAVYENSTQKHYDRLIGDNYSYNEKHQDSSYVRALNAFLFTNDLDDTEAVVANFELNKIAVGVPLLIKEEILGVSRFFDYNETSKRYSAFNGSDRVSLESFQLGEYMKVLRGDHFNDEILKDSFSIRIKSSRILKSFSETYNLPKDSTVEFEKNGNEVRLKRVNLSKPIQYRGLEVTMIGGFRRDDDLRWVKSLSSISLADISFESATVLIDEDTNVHEHRSGLGQLVRSDNFGIHSLQGKCESTTINSNKLISCSLEHGATIKSSMQAIYFGYYNTDRDDSRKLPSYYRFSSIKAHFDNGKVTHFTFKTDSEAGGVLIKSKNKRYKREKHFQEDICRTGLIKVINKKFVCSKK